MLSALRRAPLERLVQVALALTVLAFATASSIVSDLQQPALRWRWAFLLALAALALLLVLARPPRAWPHPAAYAAGALLAALAVVSAVWSPHPRLTLERAGTLVIALAMAGALGAACVNRPQLVRRLLAALVAVAVVIAAAGIATAIVDPDLAIQRSTADSPQRLQGFGMNPNTASLLYALTLPLAVWFAATVRGRARSFAVGACVLIGSSMFASGSRGATGATFIAVVLLALALGRSRGRRLALVLATAVVYAGGVGAADMRSLQPEFVDAVKRTDVRAPDETFRSGGGGIRPGAGGQGTGGGGGGDGEVSRAGRIEVEPGVYVEPPRYPLPKERLKGAFPFVIEHNGLDVYAVGYERPPDIYQPRQSGIFRGSGRLAVWQGAAQQGLKRPLLGYGFGLEEQVFADRYYSFEGQRPENSYLGWFLQLGFVGTALFLGIGVALLVSFLRGPRTPEAAATAAAALAGFAVAVMQSFVYSVGNIATIPFWLVVALLAATLVTPSRQPVDMPAVRRRVHEPVEAAAS